MSDDFVPTVSVDDMRKAVALVLNETDDELSGYAAIAKRFGSVDGPNGQILRRATALFSTLLRSEIQRNGIVIDNAASLPLRMFSRFNVDDLRRRPS